MRVEVPEPQLMLPGLRVAVRPADGFAVSMTVPLKPLMGDTVIVTVRVAPAFSCSIVVGLAVIVKSDGTRWMLMTNVLWNVNVKATK